MKTIYKYDFPILPFIAIELPEGARILTIRTQFSKVMLWAVVDTDKPMEVRQFVNVPTGKGFPEGLDFDKLRWQSTLHLEGGKLVIHVFELMN